MIAFQFRESFSVIDVGTTNWWSATRINGLNLGRGWGNQKLRRSYQAHREAKIWTFS